MKTGIQLIAEERTRQIEREGWSPEHDDFEHADGALATAAGCYATLAGAQQKFGTPDVTKVNPPRQWPWEPHWWKPSNDEIKNLVRAGALIAAEIDRLQRSKSP